MDSFIKTYLSVICGQYTTNSWNLEHIFSFFQDLRFSMSESMRIQGSWIIDFRSLFSISGSIESRVLTMILVFWSNSRLTGSPSCLLPMMVRFKVSGIRETVNQSSPTSTTVRLIPSRAIHPFGTRKRIHSEAQEIFRSRLFSDLRISLIFPVVSTCPETWCPPISSSSFRDRSMLTGSRFWGHRDWNGSMFPVSQQNEHAPSRLLQR